MKEIPFTKTNKLLVDSPGEEPYDWFRLLVDDNLLQIIVSQTNSYAVEVLSTTSGGERSRISEWKDLTVPELLIFLGLTMHTGTIRLSTIQDYWKTHRLFSTCFPKYMSRDRYLLILRCFHFSENVQEHEQLPEDRLYKIRPLLNHFTSKMQTVYYPGKTLSLDESMVLWKGRLLFKQYLPNKRHKYGIKIFMLTESDGTILDMIVYTGQSDVIGGKDHAQKVVKHLMRNYLDNGHSLYMDNFYNSYPLAKMLLDRNTFCTGTLRKNRKGAPLDVVNAKLKAGEIKSKYLNNIMIGKWRDKRDVIFISTEFKNQLVQVKNRRGVEREKPVPIIQYNKFMGGIDLRDQLMSYYPVIRKTLRWYKKVAIHILHLYLHNAHSLFNKYSGRKLTLEQFRLAVLEKLLPTTTPSFTTNVRNIGHVPVKIGLVNEQGRTLRKKCRTCTKKKIRKDTLYHCAACAEKPGLCLGECFVEYHK